MKRFLPSYISAFVLLIITLVASILSYKNELTRYQQEFNQLASTRTLAITKSFQDKLLVMESMESVFTALNEVPQPAFGLMSAPFEGSQSGIEGYRWIVQQSADELETFINTLNDTYPGMEAWELNSAGQKSYPIAKPEHFIIMPLPNGEVDQYTGFDLASRKVIRDAITKSIESEQLILTEHIELTGVEDNSNARLLAFTPIFRTEEAEGKILSGIIGGMFNIPDVVNAALSLLEPVQIRITLSDSNSSQDNSTLYQYLPSNRFQTSGPSLTNIFLPDSYISDISIGERKWQIVTKPTISYMQEKGVSITIIICLSGLVASILLPLYFGLYIQKEARIREAQAQLHETQLQLFRTQKLEVVGQMASGIAHDFNNILQSVVGYASLATEALKQSKPSRIEAHLSAIEKAGESGTNLVSKLSNFTRREQSSEKICDLTESAQSATTLLKPLLGSSVYIQFNAEGKYFAKITPTDFEQIILNLCINARDAVLASKKSTKTPLKLILQRHTAGLEKCQSCFQPFSGNYLVLSVSDHGDGIPEEKLVNIFNPFFTTKEKGKGTGMGLSIIHGIVHSANGHICVDSIPGEGCTFSIFLPEHTD